MIRSLNWSPNLNYMPTCWKDLIVRLFCLKKVDEELDALNKLFLFFRV